MRQALGVFVILVMVPWASSPVFGQRTSGPKKLCFRAGPAERCSSFLTTEFGIRYVPARNSSGNGFSDRLLVPISIGWMKNDGLRSAFGLSIGLEPDIQYSDWRVAVGPRYRFWITDHASVDGAVEFAVATGGVRTVTVHGIWMYREIFGFDAGVILDRVDDAYERSWVAPFLGIRLGSYAGSSAITGTAMLVALFVATYSGD